VGGGHWLPGEVRDHDPGEPVDETDDREDSQAQPPQPQHQEVFLFRNKLLTFNSLSCRDSPTSLFLILLFIPNKTS
jgi:hypothetical protein